MSSERDNPLTAKCALLAMLPKPKKAGDQKQTPTMAAFGIGGGAINKMNAQNASALPATKLPSSFMALRPRQAAAMPSRQNNALDNDDDDDDDAEFDMKLAEKLGRVGSGENEDDSSGSEEGPARPMNGPTVVGQKGAKSVGQLVAQITLSRPLGIDYGDSDSSDDDGDEMDEKETNAKNESMDFFGLSTSSPSPPPEKRLKMGEMEQTLDAPMFIDEVAPGPSKPVNWAEPDSALNEEQRRRRIAQLRAISDEEAQKLIYDRELAPFGANPLIAQDAVNQIVDVSVDNALGPNVRENLLRNLSGKQMAQLPLGPLPKMKKSDSDKLAKRKHQITHLASVAVSREEQLQEKWADSKQTKKMSRQKYGF